MSESEQFEQDQGEWEPPAYLAPGSPEEEIMAGLSAIVERNPELMQEGYAEAAGQAAAVAAQQIGDPELATDPVFLEMAHLANLQAAAAEAAARAPEPADPVAAILQGGKAGRGAGVLPF